MERDKNKLSVKRTGSKVKALHVSDFIALGSKSSRSQVDEPKTKAKSPVLSAPASSDRKDTPLSSSSSAASSGSKRAKSGTSYGGTHLSRSGSQSRKENKSNQWDTFATEVDSTELVSRVLEAEDIGDDEKVESILCGAVKKLKSSRAKPDSLMYLGLQFLAKTRPFLFCSELTVEALCSLLKRDITVNFKTKGNNLVSVLAANILMAAYKEDSNWPDIFVNVYIEDSLGERVWVDHEHCRGFVDNILTAFNTKPIPRNMIVSERMFKPEACPSPPAVGTDEDEGSYSGMSTEVQETQEFIPVFSRYHNEESLTQHVLEVIREQMSRRQPMEISRNTLRFLVSTSGLSEVRLISSQKLEMWLQNPKLTRPAQELLLSTCLNCNLHNQHDVEVISQLVKIRIKAKPVINHYLLCMKELISQNPDNLSTLLKHAIYNELSNSRNPNNMQLLAIIFQHSPEKAAKVLADVFFDLLLNKDDYLRALRALLREIVRTVRHDINFSVFCANLLQERKDGAFTELDGAIKERVFLSISDLIVLSIFLCITPTVKEQYSSYIKGEKKDFGQLQNYHLQVAAIERDAVWWLYSVVPKVFKPGRNDFIHSIHKILFMEQIEHYHNKDNWPTEGERMLMLRIASEIPVLEDTLMRVMIIGLSREHPLTATEALDLADQLVKRAAMTYTEEFSVLQLENPELCDMIFNLCAYHYPENISLPQGYQPPHLAISEHYWKAWMMLLIIVSHNPTSFGEMAWKTYPMLRNMMEMCITNQFVFPPPTLATGEKAEEIKNRELQMSQMEKDRILLFETHLAAASASKLTITESSSLLLSKLISMDPHGPARRPPCHIMEQLKALNSKLKLGDLLCHSRCPDFLLDIIQRQGTSQSMPWLSELVESSAGSFNMLPVQCLCEFLINETAYSATEPVEDREEKEHGSSKKKKKKQEQLLLHLQKLLHEAENDASDTIEVINYFMKRLSSQSASSRSLACRGLQMVLSQPNKSPNSDDVEIIEKTPENDFDWLLKTIPSLPHFQSVRSQISLSLRQACQIENDPATIAAYVTFLATNTPDQDLQDFADLALDMAQMIVERPTIVNTILPSEGVRNGYSNEFLSSISEILYKYLNEAKSPSKEVYSWSESQDQILIQWPNGEAATMHILVVHAMIIVLTYGPPSTGSKLCFERLLDNWFPKNSKPPKAFLVDTSEEALLLPDWLKLRMIRSSVDVLVDAALKDLDPSQLVLFIQSFGIPVSSMSKLLKTLDLAVEFDSFAVEQAVLDKSYMSQLVEVQHRRGATGGDKFAKLLIDNSSSDIDMEASSVPAQTRVIQRAPPSLPTAVSPDAVSVVMLKLFGLDTSAGILSAKQEYDLFKGLQKALSQDILNRNTDHGAVSKFVETCEHLLSSDLNVLFFQSLHRKSSYSSVLLRLVTASVDKCTTDPNHLVQRVLYVCHQFIHLGSGLKSPLIMISSQFYNRHKLQETKKMTAWKEFVRQNNVNTLSSDHITKLVQVAEVHDPLRLEEVIQYLVKCAVLLHNTKPLMAAMTSITLKRLTHTITPTPSVKSFSRSKFCFFVDWLECLEPNIASSFPEPQCQLLFSLILQEEKPVRIPFRPYLLALLIHQTSWETLQSYIGMVLDQNSAELHFDPSAVLDFLHACINIPKIWQGKYKKKCKRDCGEDVLALNKNQIIAVVSYTIEETLLKLEKAGSSISCSLVIAEPRLHLLMKCLSGHKFLISCSAKYLLDVISKGGKRAEVAKEFLLQLYFFIPSVLLLLPSQINLPANFTAQRADYTAMDVILHTLLTSLARTDSTKQCTERMTDIDLICRKIAASHSLLLLRQLPMMATLLRGRVHFDFNVFRLRNHIVLFNCFLGLLELLPPTVFRPEYSCDFHCILSLYMDMFQTYGPQKDLHDLMNRTFGLLLQYLHHSPSSARSFIVQYSSLLQELSASYPDCANLRSLLAGACVQFWGTVVASSGDSATPDVFAHVLTQSQGAQSHVSSIITRLSRGDIDEVLNALQELCVISSRKPHVLESYLDCLKILVKENNAVVRTTAFSLIMMYLKHNPRQGFQFVSTILQCLESDNKDVINSALEILPDFVVLTQEHSSVFLQKLFAVGMLISINTSSVIRDIIALLILQNGC